MIWRDASDASDRGWMRQGAALRVTMWCHAAAPDAHAMTPSAHLAHLTAFAAAIAAVTFTSLIGVRTLDLTGHVRMVLAWALLTCAQMVAAVEVLSLVRAVTLPGLLTLHVGVAVLLLALGARPAKVSLRAAGSRAVAVCRRRSAPAAARRRRDRLRAAPLPRPLRAPQQPRQHDVPHDARGHVPAAGKPRRVRDAGPAPDGVARERGDPDPVEARAAAARHGGQPRPVV